MSIDNIEDLTPRVQYTASAAQTDFDYPFPIFAEGDLAIDVDGTLLVNTTDFTLSGVGDDLGGVATLLSACVGGEIVTIWRDTEIFRTTDVPQNGGWSSVAYNDEMDRTVAVQQELRDGIYRSLRLPRTTLATTAQTELDLATWAGKYITIDSEGRPAPAALVSGTLTSDLIAGTLNSLMRSTAEIAENIFPADYSFPRGHMCRYGALGGANDDSLSLDQAVTQAQAGGAPVTIPDFACKILTGATVSTAAVAFKGSGQEISSLWTPNDITVIDFTLIAASRSRLQSFQILGKGAGATQPLVRYTNVNYPAIDDMFITKGGYGVQYLPGSIAPYSCYLPYITNSRIISNVIRNIDGGSNTNALYMANTSYGGGNTIVPAGGLKLVDSNTANIVQCDSEGCSGPSLDFDATSPIQAGHVIVGGHIENNTSSVGDIRIGNTSTVFGVTIMGTQFSPGTGADSAINAVNCKGLHGTYQLNGSYTGVPFLRKTNLENENLVSVNAVADGRPSYVANTYKPNYADAAAVTPIATTTMDANVADWINFAQYIIRGGSAVAGKNYYGNIDYLRIAAGGAGPGSGHSMYARRTSVSNGYGASANGRAQLFEGAVDQNDVTIAYGTSMSPDAALGNLQTITATDGVAFGINATYNTPQISGIGQLLTFTIRNASGGALGGTSWNAIYKMAAWTDPAGGYSRSITFKWNGTNWVEISRTPADVPN